ncbi:MAG TPA: acyl-CoA dehydrogenase family protein [Stellaceae bacterium]|nr:acyl-CoA dehydrogenase family protein [Stellaceae bacterium]
MADTMLPDSMLYDSAMRLFGDKVTPRLIAGTEKGGWPAELWDAVEAAGFPDALADGVGGMAEAAAILRAAGHHAAPIPLAETMLARQLCAAAGVPAPQGAATVAPVVPGDRIILVGDTLSGRAARIPWGRDAATLVLVAEGRLFTAPRDRFGVEADANLAGEPRDELASVVAGPGAALPAGIDEGLVLRLGAVLRAAQMAGAMEAALGLATRYANDRVQFGRPIGKFQAIQQQMALLAEEVAAALVAAERAAQALAEGAASADIAVPAAKIRAGIAAGRVADIAHQVHGAIGFTEEHSLHFLTRRLWSWRDEFGHESHWAQELGTKIAAAGAEQLWPLLTA